MILTIYSSFINKKISDLLSHLGAVGIFTEFHSLQKMCVFSRIWHNTTQNGLHVIFLTVIQIY